MFDGGLKISQGENTTTNTGMQSEEWQSKKKKKEEKPSQANGSNNANLQWSTARDIASTDFKKP